MRRSLYAWVAIGGLTLVGGCAGSQQEATDPSQPTQAGARSQPGATATPPGQPGATPAQPGSPSQTGAGVTQPEGSSQPGTSATPSGAPQPGEPFSPQSPSAARAGELEVTDEAADASEPSGERATAGEAGQRQPVAGQRASDAASQRPLQVIEGRATYYASSFDGRLTKSGERYDPSALTAATKAAGPPLGSTLRVVRKDTGASVTVRVNDRMPDKSGATVDLSRAAAERLEMIEAGIVPVRIEVLSVPEGEARPGGTAH